MKDCRIGSTSRSSTTPAGFCASARSGRVGIADKDIPEVTCDAPSRYVLETDAGGSGVTA